MYRTSAIRFSSSVDIHTLIFCSTIQGSRTSASSEWRIESARNIEGKSAIEERNIYSCLNIYFITTSKISTWRPCSETIRRNTACIAFHIFCIHTDLDSSWCRECNMTGNSDIIIRLISDSSYTRKIEIVSWENIRSVCCSSNSL